MTGPQQTPALARFRGTVDGLVGRARRVTAEERERGAAFAAANRKLAEQAKQRKVTATKADVTPPELRTAATGFRTAQRLPVEQLPDGAELLAPPPAPEPPRAPAYTEPEPEDGSFLRPVTTRPPRRSDPKPPPPDPAPRRAPAAPSRRRTDDYDDDDFSAENLLY